MFSPAVNPQLQVDDNKINQERANQSEISNLTKQEVELVKVQIKRKDSTLRIVVGFLLRGASLATARC